LSAAAAFDVLYVLLGEWIALSGDVDLDRVDAVLDGWDPEAEERVARAVQRRLRSVG
jgi:hypothetical protein